MAKRSNFLKTVGSISGATLVSRILGLIREQVQAYFFGAGMVTDAYITAFRIPNLLRDLFAEGALSSAFVPTFISVKEKNGREAAWRLANHIFGTLLLVLGILTVVIFLFAPGIIRVYAFGFHGEKLELAVTMTRIVSPFLLIVAMAAVAMGMLNACGRFFLPALAPAFFNVASISGVILLIPVFRSLGLNPGLSLAVGAILGGFLQFVVQTPALRSQGFRFRPVLALRDPGVRRVVRLMIPATFGLAATQISIFFDTAMASTQGDGAQSWLAYGFRLMQLPLGLFGVAIATANLARVSEDVARNDRGALKQSLASSLRAAALLTLPATAGLIALRVPIIRVIFEHGRFTAEATLQTAAAVLCYSLGLYAYSVTKIQAPTFYALGTPRIPVIASAVAVSVKVVSSLILLQVFPRFGLPAFLALAFTTSLAAWVNFAVLSLAIRRTVVRFSGQAVLATTLKMAGLSLVMGLAVYRLNTFLESGFGGGGFVGEILRLACGMAAGTLITLIGVKILKIPEAERLISRFTGRRGSS